MRYPIAPFRFRETLGPNLRVLHGMIHCADESLGLHGKVKSLGHSSISVSAEIFPYFLSLDERIKVRCLIFFPLTLTLSRLGRLCRNDENAAFVILNEVKNLMDSIRYTTQILRLPPQNDITTQSLGREDERQSCNCAFIDPYVSR